MKHPGLRIWTLVILTSVFVAIIIRVIWELTVNPSTTGLVMSVLVICGLVGFYGLAGYLLFGPRPNLRRSLPLWTGIAVAATGGMVAGVIHLFRFLPSPQSELPWSLVIALLYLLAGAGAYGVLLWYVWSLWKKRKSGG